jgi:hypothetical protein
MDKARLQLAEEHEDTSEMATVAAEINGVIVPLRLRVQDLQDALGLPRHSLFRQGIYASTPTPVVFTGVNVEDTQHHPDNVFGPEENE